MKFIIEQIALAPVNMERAHQLLSVLGLKGWTVDKVTARGEVHGIADQQNRAQLAFNYEAASDKPLELELIEYENGPNWLEHLPNAAVSHLGMHCTADELKEWHAKFDDLGIPVAQDVCTILHTNEAIAGKRWYRYVIFNTREIIGVDIKLIVRLERPGA